VLDGSDQQNNNRTSHRKKRRGWPLRPAGCIRLIYTNVTYLSTQICYTTSELRGSHRMAKTGCTHGWASHRRVDGLGPQRDHAGPAQRADPLALQPQVRVVEVSARPQPPARALQPPLAARRSLFSSLGASLALPCWPVARRAAHTTAPSTARPPRSMYKLVRLNSSAIVAFIPGSIASNCSAAAVARVWGRALQL
jgi:hypothetical protein